MQPRSFVIVLIIAFFTIASVWIYLFEQPRIRALFLSSRRQDRLQLPDFVTGVQWETTESRKFPFYIPNLVPIPRWLADGMIISNGFYVYLNGYGKESIVLEAYPENLMSGYRQEFAAAGWNKVYYFRDIVKELNQYEKHGCYVRFGVVTVRGNRGDYRHPLGYRVFVAHNC